MTDVTPLRVDSDKMDKPLPEQDHDVQQLVGFFCTRASAKGHVRTSTNVYEPVSTADGQVTSAFQIVSDLRTWCCAQLYPTSVCPVEYGLWTKDIDIANNVLRMLATQSDVRFPFYAPDPTLLRYQNGVLDTSDMRFYVFAHDAAMPEWVLSATDLPRKTVHGYFVDTFVDYEWVKPRSAQHVAWLAQMTSFTKSKYNSQPEGKNNAQTDCFIKDDDSERADNAVVSCDADHADDDVKETGAPSPSRAKKRSRSPSVVSASTTANHIPTEFLCPITGCIMQQPVCTSDGHTYDETAITNWLRSNATSPNTNLELENDRLIPNHALRSLIQDYMRTHPECAPTICTIRLTSKTAECAFANTSMEVDVSTITPARVREAIGIHTNRHATDVKLFLAGKELRGEKPLQNHGIVAGSMLDFHCEPVSKLLPSMQIFVKNLTGATRCLDVDRDDTVSFVKELLYFREDIPPEEQRLLFGATQLEDGKTLGESKVIKECTLHLVARLRGGCIASRRALQFATGGLVLPKSLQEQKELLRSRHASPYPAPAVQRRVLSSKTCQKLAQLEQGELRLDTLLSLLTAKEKDAFAWAEYDVLKIRHFADVGASLGFHMDTNSERTTQICLNDDFDGSRTLFLGMDASLTVEPELGSAVTHTYEMMHGATPLVYGQRSTLFLCKTFRLEDDLCAWVVSDWKFVRYLIEKNFKQIGKEDVERWNRYQKNIGSTSNKRTKRFFLSVHKAWCAQPIKLELLVKDYLQWFDALAHAGAQQEPPNVLIDFVWHAHLQYPLRYHAACAERVGFLVQHHPK